MEEELEKLEEAITKVMSSDLDNETKEIVLYELKKRLFDLRNEISVVNQNVDTYLGK